ncbi:MAG: DUF6515 family protein [Janthinobacterium lividum]|uniref:DUF6515 family protein n=1 Tax=Pseudomonas TaxID=286 RepID=UPI001CFBD5CE|nr:MULTISPECIES: DUF6515 family protein [Pseudomonas]
MNSPIWRLAGVGLLYLSVSAQTWADDNGPQNRPEGGGQNRAPQQEQRGQQQGQQVQQQMQQRVQEQQRNQQQEQRGQQQQMQQQVQQQQRELRGQQQEQQRGQQQQQQQTQWQQRQQEFNQRQAQRVQEQQSHGPQVPAPQPGRQDGPAIQGKPGVVWQTQQPIRGNNEGPRGDYGPGRGNDGRGPGGPGRGNGWGPGPQYRPGYTIDRFPGQQYRVPYRGQDFFYSGGYWYRPQGPRYVVVAPPYGIRTRELPDYATRMWIGGAVFFLAAGTYYQYMDDSQDYVVVNPPQGVPESQPQPAQTGGIDVSFYPANGQSPSQMEQDRYDCQRYAAQQSGFDPATATYAPADSVAYVYRQNMGNCLASRGYQVN